MSFLGFSSKESEGSSQSSSFSRTGLNESHAQTLSENLAPFMLGFGLPYAATVAGFPKTSYITGPNSQIGQTGYRYFPSDTGVPSAGPTGPLRIGTGEGFGLFDFPGGQQGYDPVTGQTFDPLLIPRMNEFDRALQASVQAAPNPAMIPKVNAYGYVPAQVQNVGYTLHQAAKMLNVDMPDGTEISMIQHMSPGLNDMIRKQTRELALAPETDRQNKFNDWITAMNTAVRLMGSESDKQESATKSMEGQSWGLF